MLPLRRCMFVRVPRSATGRSAVTEGVAVDLLDGVNFINVRYAPAIAARSRKGVAGTSRFAPVADTITVDVVGDTPSRAYEALTRVLTMIEQGRAWDSGENVTPVEIWVALQKSGFPTAYWYALVLGPPGDDPIVTLPGQYVSIGGTERYVIPDVSITFLRSGRWMWSIGLENVTTFPAATVPASGTATFVSAGITQRTGSPVMARATLLTSMPVSSSVREIYLMTGRSNDAFVISNADLGGPTTGFSVVADAANFPPSGNVLRYTPPGLRVSEPLFQRITSKSKRVNVFVAVRANNLASAFLVGVRIEHTDGTPGIVTETYDSHFIYVSGTDATYGNQRPRILAFGTLPVAEKWQLRLRVVEATSPAVGTCDIAYVVAHDADDPIATVVRVALPAGFPYSFSGFNVYPEDVGLPGGTVVDGSVVFPFSGSTDIATYGSTISALLITTQNDHWLPNNGTVRSQIEYTFYAYPASLVPE